MDHKSAEAPPPGVRSDPGLFFSGWCREGFWSEGQLQRGKSGKPVNLDKFLTAHKAPGAIQNRDARHIIQKFLERAAASPEPLNYDIPVFMENHL